MLNNKLTNSPYSLAEDEEREEQRYAIQFEALAHDQLRIIAQAKMTGDPVLIEMAVKHLEDILPSESRFRIQDQRDVYLSTVSHWKPLNVNSILLSGDPRNPLIINESSDFDRDLEFTGVMYELKKDGDADNPDDFVLTIKRGGPHWLSPVKKTENIVDHDQWLSLMVAELQNINAAWRQVRKARVQSRIIAQEKPTPYHRGGAQPIEAGEDAIIAVDDDEEPPNSP